MDKDKLKKYARYAERIAGYAGLGILGGFLGGFLFFLFLVVGGKYELIVELHLITRSGILITILGGGLGGMKTKKWWGALGGGFVLSWIVSLFLLSMLAVSSMR